MSRLILARHGQSVSNAVRRFQGVQDVALSELGERQAAALGQALRHRRVTAVYTSPLERARRTAEIAVKGLGLSVIQLHELPESLFNPKYRFENQLVARRCSLDSFVDFRTYRSRRYVI